MGGTYGCAVAANADDLVVHLVLGVRIKREKGEGERAEGVGKATGSARSVQKLSPPNSARALTDCLPSSHARREGRCTGSCRAKTDYAFVSQSR